MSEQTKLIVSENELSLVENKALNKSQLSMLLKTTPKKYIRERPAKGGGTWKYVSGGYVKKVLNLMFGWDWDFEILEQQILHGEAIVKGKLTCRVDGRQIVKMQFGNKDIIYKKASNEQGERVPLSIGNDLKAAATDALKKCAAEIGIAADIYNPEEFREIQVDAFDESDKLGTLKNLFDKYGEFSRPSDQQHIQRIINEQEVANYDKALNLLVQIKTEVENGK